VSLLPNAFVVGGVGEVKVTSREAKAGDWVALLPFSNDATCAGASSSLATRVRIDADGALRVRGLHAGDYRLCFSHDAVPLTDASFTLAPNAYLSVLPASSAPPSLPAPLAQLAPPPLGTPGMLTVQECDELKESGQLARPVWILFGLCLAIVLVVLVAFSVQRYGRYRREQRSTLLVQPGLERPNTTERKGASDSSAI